MLTQQTLELSWQVEGKPCSLQVKSGETIVIGRLAECDVVIPIPQVSRRHAQITSCDHAHGNVFELKNLSQSTNIFFKAPSTVAPLTFDKTIILTDGCQFILGTVVVQAKLTRVVLPEATDQPIDANSVRCANCGKVVAANLRDCPWCGTTLAFGGTLT